MGASTGDLLVDKYEALDAIFQHCPTNIVTHCEDPKRLIENQEKYKKSHGDSLTAMHHAVIRDEECCYLSSSLAVGLAKKYGSNLHVLHLSTAREMDLFESGPIENKNITAEGCVHHLTFSEKDYEELGNFIVCNPSIKTEEDRLGLIEAVKADKIDIFATDHAPHVLEGKSNDYMNCPSGIPSVQHSLLVLLELVKEGIYSLNDLPYYLSHKVADRFKIVDRGYIREGYWADCVLVDLESKHIVTKENTFYFCGWSPFEGETFSSKIMSTIVNGKLAYNNGKIVETNLGVQLKFDR